MFSVHTALEGFKKATITADFGFAFEENSVREITWLSLSKNFVYKMFSVHTKGRRFQILRVWRANWIKLLFEIFPAYNLVCLKVFYIGKQFFTNARQVYNIPHRADLSVFFVLSIDQRSCAYALGSVRLNFLIYVLVNVTYIGFTFCF